MNDENPQGYGAIRIGDAERNEAVRLLGEHFEAGRLSQDEHAERVDKALQATSRKDLDALFTDLPRDTDPGWQGPWQDSEDPHARPGWGGGPWQGGGQRQGGQRQGGQAQGGPWQGAARGYGSGAPHGGPPWARGGYRGPRGPLGIPVPLLIVLALATLAGIACTIAGGHPPFLLFLALATTAFVILRRRTHPFRT